jgi:hypothetical protein
VLNLRRSTRPQIAGVTPLPVVSVAISSDYRVRWCERDRGSTGLLNLSTRKIAAGGPRSQGGGLWVLGSVKIVCAKYSRTEGYRLVKSRARDPRNLTFGRYQIVDPEAGGVVAGWGNANRGHALELDVVEKWVSSGREQAVKGSTLRRDRYRGHRIADGNLVGLIANWARRIIRSPGRYLGNGNSAGEGRIVVKKRASPRSDCRVSARESTTRKRSLAPRPSRAAGNRVIDG